MHNTITPCTVWLLQWVEGVIDFWQDGNDDWDVEHVGRCLAESGCEASRVPHALCGYSQCIHTFDCSIARLTSDPNRSKRRILAEHVEIERTGRRAMGRGGRDDPADARHAVKHIPLPG